MKNRSYAFIAVVFIPFHQSPYFHLEGLLERTLNQDVREQELSLLISRQHPESDDQPTKHLCVAEPPPAVGARR